jgi:hypothetical protein
MDVQENAGSFSPIKLISITISPASGSLPPGEGTAPINRSFPIDDIAWFA